MSCVHSSQAAPPAPTLGEFPGSGIWVRPPSWGTRGPSCCARTLHVPCPPPPCPHNRGVMVAPAALPCVTVPSDASSRPTPTSRLFLTRRESRWPYELMLSRCWLLATPPPGTGPPCWGWIWPQARRLSQEEPPMLNPCQHPRVPHGPDPRPVGDAEASRCQRCRMLLVADARGGGCRPEQMSAPRDAGCAGCQSRSPWDAGCGGC